jgi:hypothetical protein
MNTKGITLLGVVALSTGLLCYGLECPNTDIVQGTTDCSTEKKCSNHTSPQSCTTGVTYVAFPNTGTVSNRFVNKTSTVCTTSVACDWIPSNNVCQVRQGSEGDTSNALAPTSGGDCI